MNVTQRIKNQIKNAHMEEANVQTKAEAELRKMCIDMYRGNQEEYIKKYNHFTDSTRQYAMQYAMTNITQKIIKRVCLTYLNVPERWIELNGKEISDERLEKYLKLTKKKKSVMIELDRYSELLNYVGVKVEWNAERNQIKYRKLIDHIYFDVDQYGDEITAVWFPILPCEKDRMKKHKIMYEFWNKEERFIVDYDGNPSLNQEDYGFYDNVNHYGLIPIALISKDDEYAKILVKANININSGLTQLNELIKYKSFGVPYATGLSTNDTIKYNPEAFILLDPGEKAGMLAPGGDIVSVIEGIKFQISQIAEEYGVSFAWSIQGNVSGFSLMVQNVELYDQIKIDNEKKREWEEEIFRIENRVIEVDAKGEKYGDELLVNFVEYTMPINNAEQDAHEKHLLATGQTNPIELMMSKDPDLSEEDARERYEQNLEMMKRNTEATAQPQQEDELGAIINA